jgi:hypothetical protein
MINLIKRWGIGIVDLANSALDPYDDFDRAFLPPDPNVPLCEKAEHFAEMILRDFRLPDDTFAYNRVREWEEPDFGDTALWHNVTTAAIAFGRRLGFVQEDDVIRAVIASGGLFLNGKLIRGWDPRPVSDPAARKFADNVSNDGGTGALAGPFFAWKYGGPDAAAEAVTPMKALADELIAHDYALVRQDGTPTTYGRLIHGALTDPQRASLAMAILRAAHVMAGDRRYGEHFEKLYRRYGSLLRFAEFKFLDFTKPHEPHRCAIHLHILAELSHENREMLERCAGGLARIWKLHRKTRDPWLAALAFPFYRPDPDLAQVIFRLHEYPVMGKPACAETLNSQGTRREYWEDRGVRFITVRGTVRASQPLPYHMQPSADFWPQRHPYTADGYAGSNDTFVRHSPADFLAAYGLLRIRGAIPEAE